MEIFALLPFLAIIVVIILIIRLFGAWMLRIDDIIRIQKDNIKIQKEILKTLKEIRLDTKIQTIEIKNKKL